MEQAVFRFYSELNDFLPPDRKQISFTYHFKERGSIKDAIEALGIPHTEVELILANGESVDFSYLVQNGDRISVYPFFTSLEIASLVRVRPQSLPEPRFVLDAHLGKLATYLRLLGFDALYQNDYHDEELARIASCEGRILLTRDRALLKRSIITHGYCLRTTDSWEQLLAVLQRFRLFGAIAPFRRCRHCNSLLEAVDKETIRDRLEPLTEQYFDEFSICRGCGQIYWKGSHYERIQVLIDRVLQCKTDLR